MNQPEYVMAHGDISLSHGGLFVADQGHGWAEVVEVTDLDSAVGTTNLVLVEQGQVTIPYRLSAARQAFRQSWQSCGPGSCQDGALSGLDRPTARMLAFAAMWEYGHRDVERCWTIATDREFSEWAGPDRWRVSVERVPLRGQPRGPERWRRPVQVNGDKGLWRWLRVEFGIERASS